MSPPAGMLGCAIAGRAATRRSVGAGTCGSCRRWCAAARRRQRDRRAAAWPWRGARRTSACSSSTVGGSRRRRRRRRTPTGTSSRIGSGCADHRGLEHAGVRRQHLLRPRRSTRSRRPPSARRRGGRRSRTGRRRRAGARSPVRNQPSRNDRRGGGRVVEVPGEQRRCPASPPTTISPTSPGAHGRAVGVAARRPRSRRSRSPSTTARVASASVGEHRRDGLGHAVQLARAGSRAGRQASRTGRR